MAGRAVLYGGPSYGGSMTDRQRTREYDAPVPMDVAPELAEGSDE